MKANVKEIKPGEGLGDVKFGMTREEVKAILGEPDEKDNFSYTDSDEELTESWDYMELGLSLSFDEDEHWKLVMISVVSDAYTLFGKPVIGLGKDELQKLLESENIGDIKFEDWSSAENPDHKLMEVDEKSISFWLDEGKLDEVQWSPMFLDDDTFQWPEK